MKKHILLLFLLLPSLVAAQLIDRVDCNERNLTFETQNGFDRIKYGDCYTSETGKPQLPIISRSFVIPNEVVVKDLEVQVLNEKRLPGVFYVYPAQPPKKFSVSEPDEYDTIHVNKIPQKGGILSGNPTRLPILRPFLSFPVYLSLLLQSFAILIRTDKRKFLSLRKIV